MNLAFYSTRQKGRAAKDHGKKFQSKLAASFSDIVHWTK